MLERTMGNSKLAAILLCKELGILDLIEKIYHNTMLAS